MAETRWGVPVMPTNEIKPGMSGIGKTVFYGNKIDEFGFEVLDIIKNFYPKQDVILVRLTGEKAEMNGVVSGMSGSPMYIDGKLIGALAIRFGSFMKEPIGGVMPIEEMYPIVDLESKRGQETTINTSLLPGYMDAALCGTDGSIWQNLATGIIQSGSAEQTSAAQIQSPLLFSGFDSRLVAQFSSLFEPMGFTVTSGGSGSQKSGTDNTPVEPGSAISQVFISGDMSIESTGTVTAVYDQKLLAFGHYIFNMGPINLPLARANILATLPSMMGSSKMAASDEIIGTFRQDRLTGVYGDLSIKPNTVPVDIDFKTVTGKDQAYHFDMAQDKSLNNIIPLFLRSALIQALTAGRLAGNLNSMDFQSTVSFVDGREIKLDDFFSSEQRFGFLASGMDANQAADLLASALGVLMVNDFESPDIQAISVKAHEIKGERIAKIKNIWQNKKTVTPNDTLNFSIDLETTDNQKIKLSRSFAIPQNIDARQLIVFISSAATLTQYEIQTNRSKYIPVNFDHMLSILRERRKNNHLYIQIQVQDRGLLLEGNELSALPPSVMNVMGTIKTNSSSKGMQNRVLYEESIPTDYEITGAKRLSVRVNPPGKAAQPDEDEQQQPQPVYW